MMWFIPKNKKVILSLTAGLCLSLGFMTGCKESAPPAKPVVEKTKIEQTSPAAKVTEAEKAAPAAETAGPKATATEQKTAPAAETAAQKTEKPAQSVSETSPAKDAAPEKEKAAAPPETTRAEPAADQKTQQGEGTMDDNADAGETETASLKSSLLDETFPKYDPEGKIDPFVPLFSSESEKDLSADSEPKRPLTPLEKIDISQLKLTAIILAESGSRAMVVDGTGKPYVLTPGTYVGMNSGTVTKILKDRVVVEEKTKDFLGREHTNTRELKLQKPLGEE